MKKVITTIVSVMLVSLLLVGAVFCFTGCQNKKDDSKLYVGMECGYAPFNYTQTDASNGAVKISNAEGYANGYDIMIAQKIADSLGKKLVIKKLDWDSLLPGVTAGTLDFIIAGMSPTAERLQQIDFSDAYYQSQLVLVVKKDGKYANATTLAEFKGANLVAQNGTFHDKALERQAADIGYTRRTPMDSFPAMVSALKNDKNLDGYVAEEPGAIADCAANPEFTYIPLKNNTTGFIASDEDTQIAIGMKKGSQYKDAVNKALAAITKEEREQMMEKAKLWSTQNN